MRRLKLRKDILVECLILSLGFVQCWASYQPNDYQFDPRDDVQERLFQLSMDQTIRPCDDFYGYACGNWKSTSEKDFADTLTQLDFSITKELGQILHNFNHSAVSGKRFVQQVHNYYKSCRSVEAPVTVEYIKWLELHEPHLQWPISVRLGDARRYGPQRYDWIRMLATLRKYGLNDVILNEMAVPKEMNPNILNIQVGRPREDEDKITTLRYDVVTGTLRFFMQHWEYQQLWNDIQDLDNQLLELKTKYEGDDEMMFTTVSSLSDLPWLIEYLGILLDITNVDPSMELVITNMAYLRDVIQFLRRYDDRFICEYLQVKFLSYLNHKQFRPVYRDCVSSTRLILPLATQWLYEQQHPEFDREVGAVSLLFTKLKQTLQTIITKNVYNLDQPMMKFFKGKLRTLQLRIGYLTSSILEDFYGQLTLDPYDYYGNRLKIYKFHFQVIHRHLNVRLKRNSLQFLPLEQHDTAKSLLPYTLPRQRAILVPYATLQYPYYRPELPSAYVYSSLGFLLARQFMWEFTIADIDVNAYGQIISYILDLLLENPEFKMDYEHIAHYHRGETEQVDSAINGLKLAYQSFKEDQPDETMMRSFFLNFAQMHCGTNNSTNPHRPSQSSINHKLVNLAVNHIGDFAQTFHCSPAPVHGVLYWGRSEDS